MVYTYLMTGTSLLLSPHYYYQTHDSHERVYLHMLKKHVTPKGEYTAAYGVIYTEERSR